MSFYKERIYPVVFMFVVSVISISLVSFIHLSTLARVKSNESLFLRKAILYAANIPYQKDFKSIDSLFNQRVVAVKNQQEQILYYKILNKDLKTVGGYALAASGPGLWGEIKAIIGFAKDRETITGLDFIKQNETPGLGARIMENWFREQFRGRKGPFVMVPEKTAPAPQQLDAITGATRTSDFVLDIVNKAWRAVKTIIKE